MSLGTLGAAIHHNLPALAVGIPLLVGAALVAANAKRARRVADTIALATALLVVVICAFVLVEAVAQTRVILWFGGWTPQHGVAIGIAFAVDPVGAALAMLAAVLVSSSLLFSWRYFEAVGHLYHTLMLVFLGAMVGFCFTGDLFNLFVFFELMSVAGFALAGYMIEEPGPLQGAINFGVTNTVGGFCILTGIGLLYGRTGALNLAQLGQTLARHPDSRLMAVAMTLILGGFLVKAAAIPFHFWLADAHAVAPTPVCVLFSGVMVELGLYAVARVYWTVFWPAFGDALALRVVFLGSGLLTMLLGGLEALAQQHLKRLLAFSTISHVGMFLIGISLLTPDALAAVAVFIAAHGLLKGSLFQSAGILMHRFDTIDEGHLHGRGRGLPIEGIVFGVGALCLAGLPLAGSGLGHELLDDAATTAQLDWLPPLLLIGGALPAAAVLRAAAHIYLGLGRRMGPKSDFEGRETRSDLRRTPVVMLAPCAALLAGSVALAWVAGLPAAAEAATRAFRATE
ncbi:MAG: NADH-quinone oxidoreductase subunit D, partial [Candidatus Dormibacteraeota bacterium]|nr:NADH-quinone oxidoreductase subunit D [Candidatus Dormibacteraeota bacterium]